MPTQAIDTAALRLYYLQQLGVSLYVPREAASIGEIALAEVQELPVMQTVPAAERSVAAAGPRLSLLDDAEIGAERPALRVDRKIAAAVPAASPVTAGSLQDESGAIAPFQLLFCMPDPRLAVALQIPALAKPALQEAEARLLQNMLRWLGIRHEGAFTGMLHFKWPLPGMPAADVQTAGRNLQVFLQQAATTQPLQRLLLLGQGPAQCLEAVSAAAALPYQCWTTHSLAEMLAVPELKREVWRQLLPLHGQL